MPGSGVAVLDRSWPDAPVTLAKIAQVLAAQAHIGFGAGRIVAELLEDRQNHLVFAFAVAAHADAQDDDGVEGLFDAPDQADHFLGAFDRDFDLHDRRHDFLH